MKKFLTAIALISLLTIPALESANAALVEPRIWRQRLLTSSRTNEHLCSLSRRLSWQCNGTAPDRDRRRR